MKKQNVGSDFDEFLAEEHLLEATTAVAVKRVIAWQIEQEMAAQKLTKTAMARKRRTSCAVFYRRLIRIADARFDLHLKQLKTGLKPRR